MSTSKSTVFVSGASGFIAQHIISLLLEQNYKVIGSVRSNEKAEHVLSNFNHNPNLTLEIVKDLASLTAFDEVFKKHGDEIKIVLHAASPVVFQVDNFEKDILIPAVNGVKSMLNAILKYAPQTVERLIYTSSIVAQFNPCGENEKGMKLA